ncbi:MAG: DUF2121 domain-containing protein [Methanobacteriaceae archaeon]
MSLIIAYISEKGCVMAGDKRKIAFFGDTDKREKLEVEIYSGIIKTQEELEKKAKDMDITLKITEDASKVRSIADILVGEVSTKTPFESRRKRVYATTNGYEIVELKGSEIINRESGNKAIIIFGNKLTKGLANDIIASKFKSSLSLKYIGEIFEYVIGEIAKQTPSLGSECDIIIKSPKLDNAQAKEFLDETIKVDIKVLQKFRETLGQEILEKSEEIKLAEKIINKGEIGKINSIEGKILKVILNSGVQAFDSKWKQVAKSGEIVLMVLEDNKKVNEGDLVVIENEILCIKSNNANLSCNIILCNE